MVDELHITPNLTSTDLKLIRRRFAKANHPDRVAPAVRDQATRRMTIANSLIDEALRGCQAAPAVALPPKRMAARMHRRVDQTIMVNATSPPRRRRFTQISPILSLLAWIPAGAGVTLEAGYRTLGGIPAI